MEIAECIRRNKPTAVILALYDDEAPEFIDLKPGQYKRIHDLCKYLKLGREHIS